MKKNHHLQKVIIAGCIVLVGCAGAIGFLYSKQSQNIDIEEEQIDPNVEVLSPEAYEKMEIGMSSEEVLEIAGIEPSKHHTSPDGTISTFQWHAPPGANVYSIVFTNNKLQEKNFIDIIKLKEEAQKK